MIPLPKSVELEELLNMIREISWNVSDIFTSYDPIRVNKKELVKRLNIQNLDKGPVTDADIEVSELIKRSIKQRYPLAEWDFLSEEDKISHYEKISDKKWVWIIDPLDGTKDFINKTGEYAMHLALTFEKRVILGIVLISTKNQLWFSIAGEKTWYENKNLVKTICVKESIKNINQISILTSKSHMHESFQFLLNDLKPNRVIGMGSIGYKITSILRGEGDVYISYSLPSGTCPRDWDIAAPASLIKGAGGFFTDINGKELEFLNEGFNQRGILIASLNKNHFEICRTISNIVNT